MHQRTFKTMLVVLASCTGISILIMEFLFLCFGEWRVWLAAFREPVDLFSDSYDLTQLEEFDVVRGTIRALGGSYSYTYDNGIQDTAYFLCCRLIVIVMKLFIWESGRQGAEKRTFASWLCGQNMTQSQ